MGRAVLRGNLEASDIDRFPEPFVGRAIDDSGCWRGGPCDSLVLTVESNSESKVRSDLALAVRLNGQYKAVAWASAPASAVVDCPPNEGFGESVYVRCLQVPTQDGTTHFLAYQGPCT